jgi:DNA-binding MarR family transcriptional regulator
VLPIQADGAGIEQQKTADGRSKTVDSGVISEVLALLSEKGCAVEQSEIARSEGLTGDEVATALADLEQSGLIQRTWDRERATYLVELL